MAIGQHTVPVSKSIPVPTWTSLPCKQEAQLSQTDRATLRVTGYFAKSLKVIRNDTVE